MFTGLQKKPASKSITTDPMLSPFGEPFNYLGGLHGEYSILK